jgi:hypothetical protein
LNEKLAFLLGWVGECYTREGDLSLREHQALFDVYRRTKVELLSLPTLDPPAPELLAWLT